MSSTNAAAWIPGKGKSLSIAPSEMGIPGPDEILIENQAWGINPIDWKIQDWGVQIQSYPAIFGCDIAGRIVATGDNVTAFKVGQRVLAYPLGLQNGNLTETAFQLYTVVSARCAVSIPDEMPFGEAVKLPLGMMTAATGLFTKAHLGLDMPRADPQPSGRVLVVLGGSSNVGSSAIQLAKASRLQVVATASSHNFGMLQQLGVMQAFDYNAEGMAASIGHFLKGKEVTGILDAIGNAQSTQLAVDILQQLGGGKIASCFGTLDSIPASINAKRIFAPDLFLTEPAVGEAVWNNFLPQALASGQIRPVLKTHVAGHGLERTQHGIDVVRNGVSATKVVVLK